MVKLWEHYCPIEKTVIFVGQKEPCNWCGCDQNSAAKLPSIISKNSNKHQFRD